ncbi:MAG: hypothetical protein M1821_009810 [Bathelium mastoideum]|nr:MAG: hypothetical protein M1821_009810 [Bathelium mastoideum]
MSLTNPPTTTPSLDSRSPSSFFRRNGLVPADRQTCNTAAARLHPDAVIREFEHQGYCSYTLSVSFVSWSATHTSLLQFRPPQFGIDVETVARARQVYGEHVPRVWCHGPLQLPSKVNSQNKKPQPSGAKRRSDDQDVNKTNIRAEPTVRTLLLYEMDLLSGTPYADLQPHNPILSPTVYARQLRLVRDLAQFLARSYPHAERDPLPVPTTPTSSSPPLPNASLPPTLPTAKVAPQLTFKLARLATALPSAALRARAAATLAGLHTLRRLPRVLTHGDVVPGNVLVDATTGVLRGVVDWAEAEVLPWGVAMYGVEFLLGYVGAAAAVGERGGGGGQSEIDVGQDGMGRVDEDGKRRRRSRRREWVYYSGAAGLRRAFWQLLVEEVPGLGADGDAGRDLREAVKVARDVGVLLWFGYAWDEGRIDRVVDWERDEVECACLEAFLSVEEDGLKGGEAKL